MILPAEPPPPDLVRGSLAAGEGIICVGLPRSGTLSMAMALNELGFRHVHHIFKFMSEEQWAAVSAASRAHFPWLSRHRHHHDDEDHQDASAGELKEKGGGGGGSSGEDPAPWAKEDWDRWVGGFQAVTDAGGFFAAPLLRAYPGARVILMVRPFDRWAESMDETLIPLAYGGWRGILRRWVEGPLSGSRAPRALRDLVAGWLEAETAEGARENLRRRYNEHHYTIRKMVPRDRLLVYELGDGWGPLARFLEREVPVVPFPRLNDRGFLRKAMWRLEQRRIRTAVITVLRWLLPLVGFGFGFWVARSETSVEAMLEWLSGGTQTVGGGGGGNNHNINSTSTAVSNRRMMRINY
ncbi:hypothetical protein BX600DRAFT_519863 [Xylariales sp. PMI_506]|nr:hypothetical protein BX600DRAFT_519863 [Xylariales sp. PMI_506]